MKKLQLFALFCICIFNLTNTYAQNPEYVWAKKAGGSYTDQAKSVTTDANGNVIITGTFYSSSISFGNISLTKPDSVTGAMFVAKYDPDGNILWAKRAATPGLHSGTTGNSVISDSDGNIYVCGDLGGDTIDFDSQTIVLPDPYGNASFLVKYDASGTFTWAKMALNGRGNMASAIDGNGDIYITGITNNLVEFDGVVHTIGAGGVYIAKYSNSGNFIWANLSSVSISSYGFNSEWMSYGVCTDNDNSVYVTGWSGPDTMFFNSAKTVFVTNNPSLRNFFLVKFDVNGNALWAKGASRTETPGISSAIDGYSIRASGNHVYLAGTVTGDSVRIENSQINTIPGYADYFIAKYDKSGINIWVQSIGSNSVEYGGNSLDIDNSGNIYMGGITNGAEIHMNTIPVDTIIGGNNAMIFKLDTNGNFMQLKNPVNLTGVSACNSIAIDPNDNIYITGSYSSGVAFGIDTLYSNSIWDDAFLAKLINSPTVSIDQIESPNTQIVLYPNPANDFIDLVVKYTRYNEIEINIYNLTGYLVKSEKIYGTDTRIKIGDLGDGIYVMTIKSGNFCDNRKFIIQR